MNPKNAKPKERKIGTQKVEKKPLIDPRYKNLIYTVGFIAVILVFFIVNNSQSEPEQGPYPPNYNPATQSVANPFEGKMAPDFELKTCDGKKLKLSDFKGKVILLDFWATWCAPCRRGIPDLVALKNEYKNKGLEIIGVSLDQDNTIANVLPFIKEFKINYPVVYYNMDIIQNYGGIESIPTSFIINKDGKVVKSYIGLTEKAIYNKEIKKLLATS
ncbi:MAG: redoxin domain-containing protein [Ignavibacteriales bacterium]|nr:redoxin domain-containing protein [Ignavibacteriales bacterium]